MGIGKRSLVVDSDYTSEVWNMPVISYEAEYYNLQTSAVIKMLLMPEWQEGLTLMILIRVAGISNGLFRSLESG